jgi:uncharacterized protein (UPF0333 family)
MENRILNNRGQGTLEMAFVIIIMVLFLGGIINIWFWANNQMARRQIEYNSSRVIAGTSSDAYSLQWPMNRPDELGEDKVLLDAP